MVGGRSAEVKANASGGGISLAFDEAPNTVDVDSSGGGVTVILPQGDAAYAVDAQASGGATKVGVSTNPASQRRIRLRSSGGGVTVRYGAP